MRFWRPGLPILPRAAPQARHIPFALWSSLDLKRLIRRAALLEGMSLTTVPAYVPRELDDLQTKIFRDYLDASCCA